MFGYSNLFRPKALALASTFGLCLLTTTAHADWFGVCQDFWPDANGVPNDPYSDDISGGGVETPLFSVLLGASGTVDYGHEEDNVITICDTPRTFDFAGGFSFGIPGGTIQSGGEDAGMALTFGWPTDALIPFGFFRITSDGSVANSALFGEGGYTYIFQTASKRTQVIGQAMTVGGEAITTEATIRAIGDAAQFRFKFIRAGAGAASAGVIMALTPGMKLVNVNALTGRSTANMNMPVQGLDGTIMRLTPNRYLGYNITDSSRPLRTERRYEPGSNFPNWVKFLFGQSVPYGMRIDTQPDQEILDDADTADLVVIGNRGQTISGDSNVNFQLFGDATGLANETDILLGGSVNGENFGGLATLFRYPVKSTTAATPAETVIYLRLAHTTGYYFDPYTIVMDAPTQVPFSTATGYPATVPVGLWIDNQYADIEKEVTLNNVRMTITIPENKGLRLAPGESRIRNLGTVAPNAIRSAQWNMVVNPTFPGNVEVTIEVESVPGPKRTIKKVINVPGSPTYTLHAGANLLGFPFEAPDTSIDKALLSSNIDPATGEAIPYRPGTDFVAYTWDPTLRTYVPTLSLQRGVGSWLVPTGADIPNFTVKGGISPTDIENGGLIVGCRPGWNLIANPYNYGMKLGELTGVIEDDPESNRTWDELVRQNAVSGAVTTWNATTGQYDAIAGLDAVMEPLKGYWVYVSGASAVRLVMPPMFAEGAGGIVDRSENKLNWKNTDKSWRLQLAAHSNLGSDTNNFVGVSRDTASLNQLNVLKPPMAPGAQVELSVAGTSKLSETRMSQSIASPTSKRDWKVSVKSEKPGVVNVTWPNLGSIPRNVRFTLKDDVTGETKDLRATSGTSVNFAEAGTRSFTLSMVQAGSSKPVISNALVTRSSRENNAPVQISYTLSDSALVTVRVLSATGKEVFTATRGRADSAGQNSVTWTLRDNANRAVAPGTYKVEILAETTSGDRVRRVVPVNVIR